MTDAYSRQVAGSHYVNMGIQPFQFAMRNGWDSTSFSILKYLSRHRSKKGVEDLRKALHIIDIRLAEIDYAFWPQGRITMVEYIASNAFCDTDAWALLQLENWVCGRLGPSPLRTAIDVLIKEYEGKYPSLLPSA